ncbi:MAG TPA: phasin family protein [Burkholderiales bacterium]|nr:phasin family protein [Burkholderiales bacterium]
MYNVPEQVAAAQKENLETMIELAGITASGAERLMEINLKTAKATFADAMKGAQALTEAKDAQSLASLGTTWAQPTAEKTTSYFKTVYGVLSETQAELTKLFEQRVVEFNKTFASALDQAAKNAPAGSDVAVAAVKSAMAAANQAYDAFSKASKQATENTEAAISATTGATSKKKAA